MKDTPLRFNSSVSTLKPLALTITDTCRVSGLGRTTIYDLLANGSLQTVTIGRRRLVMFASLEAMFQPKAA